MKKILRLGISVCCFLLTSILLLLQVTAQSHSLPSVVKVGYFDYPGFIEQDDQGEFSGYGYEYLEEIANYTGWKYDFVYGTWEDCLKRLEKGEIDLLCTAQYTEERARVFDYAKYESGIEYGALFVAKGNNQVYYNDTESFDGLRIAFLTDSYQNKLFEEYAEENHFTYIPRYYVSAQDTASALEAGEVDAVVSGSLRRTANEKVVAKFSPDPFYFTTTKGNQAVMDGINLAMEEIRTADVYFNAKLYDKYYGESVSNQLAFTRKESEYIQEHPVLRVVCNSDWVPIEYWDKDGRFSGTTAEMMELISEKSGIRFEYLQVKNFQEAQERVEQGQAEIICGYSRGQLQKADDRSMFLTKPYLEVPVTLAIRAGSAFGEVKKIAVPEYFRGIEPKNDSPYKQWDLVYCPDLESCIKMVREGKADAVFDNDYLMNQYLSDGVYGRIVEPVYISDATYPLSIGISQKQDLELLSILNKVILQISDREEQQVILNNTAKTNTLQIRAAVRRYSLVVLIGLMVVILALALRSKKVAERYAYVDPLTKGRNQLRFVLDAEKARKGKNGPVQAILSFDIDKFKIINDMHGYEFGNQLLCLIAMVIRQNIKENELFCRATGDQFHLYLVMDSEQELEKRASLLMEAVCESAASLKKEIQMTVSCGIYVWENEPVSVSMAIDRASLARKSVKQQHKTSLAYYNASMREKIIREKEIENRMQDALYNGEFVVYYQPKFSLVDQGVIGAEALVRWIPENGGMIYPDEFIPIFESNGFIVDLDLFVFRKVCADLRSWLDEGWYPYPVSVNLSRVHLYQTDFYIEYLEAMAQYQVPAYLIELELTENAIFDNQVQLITVMNKLKESGLSLSMDDFGSGYSSLNLLKDMPIDFLKLDREFFNVSTDTERGKKIVRCIVAMARELGISVISEGVETMDQVDFLREINCDIAQGYYFSKPITKEAFEALAYTRNDSGMQEVPYFAAAAQSPNQA